MRRRRAPGLGMSNGMSASAVKSGGPETYTISGTIEDGDSAAVEGVTVTLTGDASDATTTNASGEYEFTGLLDGSYTVTPTKTDYTFSPTSTNVTVSGGDQTGKDFTATSIYLPLPYFYNFGSRSEAAGTALASLSGFNEVHSTIEEMLLQTANLTDSNSYTPTGVTKYAERSNTDAAGFGFTFPNSKIIESLSGGLRFAVLFYRPSGGTLTGIRARLRDVTWPEDDGGASESSRLQGYYRADQNPDDALLLGRWEDDASTDSSGYVGAGGSNRNYERWVWLRVQVSFATNFMSLELMRVEDSQSLGSISFEINAAGQTLGHVPSDMKEFVFDAIGGQITRCAGFWVGEITDAYPTTTLGATTEDYS